MAFILLWFTMAHLPENEIVWTTFYTIDNILSFGNNWPDALALYFKYIEQSRIQMNNQTYSLDVFMMKKMWRWELRLRKSKKILKDLWLIDQIQIKDVEGKIQWAYVRVNFMISQEKIRTSSMTYEVQQSTQWLIHSVDIPPRGEWETNTSILNINTSIPNINTCNFEMFWKLFPHARKWKKKEAEWYFNKCICEDVIAETKLLCRKIEVWEQDWKFIPACERWIRDFTTTWASVKEQTYKSIIMYLKQLTWDKRSEVVKRLKEDFWDDKVRELWELYWKAEPIKLIFKDDNWNKKVF